ncbi:hypothetical protein DSO57_1035874 [Entomophthora muscae]|uniref:Uncharacterized protein n=1 Tax=Entomophthora muscae TaxID=34485 RepID=A0ACC2U8F7_9FUNG|nr:hypothetical protein DSO57_1035874 [Entomophthora muscae]
MFSQDNLGLTSKVGGMYSVRNKRRKVVLGFTELTLGLSTDAVRFELYADNLLDAAQAYQENLIKGSLSPKPPSITPEDDLRGTNEKAFAESEDVLDFTLEILSEVDQGLLKIQGLCNEEPPLELASENTGDLDFSIADALPPSGQFTVEKHESKRSTLANLSYSIFSDADEDPPIDSTGVAFHSLLSLPPSKNIHDTEKPQPSKINAISSNPEPTINVHSTLVKHTESMPDLKHNVSLEPTEQITESSPEIAKETPAHDSEVQFIMPPSIQNRRQLNGKSSRLPLHAMEIEAGRFSDNIQDPSHASYTWPHMDVQDLSSPLKLQSDEVSGFPVVTPLPARRMALVSPGLTKSQCRDSIAPNDTSTPLNAASVLEVSPGSPIAWDQSYCESSRDFGDYSGSFNMNGVTKKSISPSAQSNACSDLDISLVSNTAPFDPNESIGMQLTPSFLRSQLLPAPEDLKPSSPLLALQNKKKAASEDILDDSLFNNSTNDASASSYPEWCHPGPDFEEQLKLNASRCPADVFGGFKHVNINDLLQRPNRIIRVLPLPVIKPWEPLPMYTSFPLCQFRQDDPRRMQHPKPPATLNQPKPPLPLPKPLPQKPKVVQKHNSVPKIKSTTKTVFRPNQARRI